MDNSSIEAAPKFKHPVLVDRILGCIQDSLIGNIGWLDHAFGRAQRLVTTRGQGEYYYPGVYAGNGEYLNVLPGQGLGNRSFFVAGDPETIDSSGRFLTLRRTAGLVCWYDLSTIYPDSVERNTEAAKWRILGVLDGIMFRQGMRMSFIRAYDQAENIFREYSLREIDTQYLMHPYAGVRVDLELTYGEDCM